MNKYIIRIISFSGSLYLIYYLLTINEIIFASILSSFTEILPINSFGTFELGWAGALIYSGISSEIAIESGFSFHFVAF